MANSQGDGRTAYDVIDETQANLSETTAILKNNVNKFMERGERLENIVESSERLTNSSNTFRFQSTRLRRTMWLRNRWLTASIVIVVICIIILIIILTVQPWKK